MKLLFALILLGSVAHAQSQFDLSRDVKGTLPLSRLSKAGAQPNYCLQIDSGFNIAWAACASGGGTGTVTSFGASGLSPLFTVSTANPTTTPALSFTLSNAAAHTFFGNNTGSLAAPGYVSITAADLPGVFAQTLANASHKWFNSYNASTGLFTQTQPDYSDLTGTPTLPATLANVAHKWLNSYISNTGLFTQTQPDYSDLTGTPTLPANAPAVSHQFVTAYNSTTGAFSQAQPSYSDLSGSAPVTSVFSRTGAVTAATADYTAAQVTNAFDVTVADTLTNVAAPATPPAGKTAVYVDSTNKVLSSKNDGGTVSNTVVPDAGAANNFLTAVSATGVISKAQPSFPNISGSVAASQLPNPSATTLGGIESLASTTSKWINAISTSGVPSATQPAFSDVSGSATCAQLPALTGNVTSPAGSCATTIAAAAVSRADLAAGATNWAFCGTATGATTTVGPVNASTCCSGGTCRQFQIYYHIEGYNGGTPVGRLLMGPGTPSTTALTNGNALLEGTTTITTTSVSVPGIPLAVTLSAISREGIAWIDGASGKFKRINIIGQEGNQSVSAAPTLFRAASNFSDLSTNLPLQQFQLTVYDTLTSTSASAQTFTSGTYLAVWGRNTD